MKSPTILLFSLILATICHSSVYADEDNTDDIISYRQAVMKSISGHYKAIKLLSSGKVNKPDQLLQHSRALKDLGQMITVIYPEGSDFGETDAKEAIWENKEDFNQKAEDLVSSATQLVQSSENKDSKLIMDAADKIGETCKSCHKKYREK